MKFKLKKTGNWNLRLKLEHETWNWDLKLKLQTAFSFVNIALFSLVLDRKIFGLSPFWMDLGLGLFQNMFHNLLMYTDNFFFGYIAVSCFFETFPADWLGDWKFRYCHSLVLILIQIPIKTRIDNIIGLKPPHPNKRCLSILE